MDNEKIQSLISQLKGVGLGDEEILDVFYATFKKGKMDRKDLETLADSLGYELDDDFKEDKTPDPIEGGEPDITKEEAEDLKEIKPGESKEEFKEKVDEAKDEMEADADDKKEEEDHEEKSEEDKDEWEEANKYFKI